MSARSWFITGSSRGFGREWAIAALERGDTVAATARDTATLDDLAERYGDRLLPLRLDVTDRAARSRPSRSARAVRPARRRGQQRGLRPLRAIEELSEAEARAQIETNFFGALWVTQAALPILRAQGSGHILQVSSIGGISASAASAPTRVQVGARGVSQALAQEVAPFGIRVTLIEPGGFATDWAGPSAKHATALPAYDAYREEVQRSRGPQPAAGRTGGERRPCSRRRRRGAAPADLLRRRTAGRRDAGLRVTPRRPGGSGSRCRSPRAANG